MKLARTSPCWSSWASQTASLTSVFRPRHRLEMLGVPDHHPNPPAASSTLYDGLPVHPRRFHHHVDDLPLPQPRRQRFQVGRHRPEPLRLGLRRPTHRRRQRARHDVLLVDVQPAHRSRMMSMPSSTVSRLAGRSNRPRAAAGRGRLPPRRDSPSRAHPDSRRPWQHFVVPRSSLWAILGIGLVHQTCGGLAPRPTLIFILRGAALAASG